MGKDAIKIYDLKAVAMALGLSRGRIDSFIREKRMLPDYVDNEGRKFWTLESIEAYKQVLAEVPQKKGVPRIFDVFAGADAV